MEWLVMLVTGAALGAVLAAAVLPSHRRFAARAAAAILAVTGLFLVSVLLWRQVLIALTVLALFALALGVLFQRVPPSKAIRAAVAALFLIFALTWLTLRLGEAFLFAPQDQPFSLFRHWRDSPPIPMEVLSGLDRSLFLILSLATLAAGTLLKSWVRALAVFAGLIFAGLWARAVYPEFGPGLELAPIFRDPLVQGTLAAVIVAGLMRCLFAMGRPGGS